MARDNETLVDKELRRAKNNPLIAGLILLCIVVGGFAVLITQLDDARRVFWPPTDAPVADAPIEEKRPEAPAEPKAEDKPKPEPPQPATTSPTATKDDRVFVHCEYGVMAGSWPPHGRIYVLSPHDRRFGSGFMEFFGKPWSDWNFKNSEGGPAWSHRCELTNYSADVLFNLSIAVGLTFRESLPVPGQGKSRKEGPVTFQGDWMIRIPKLDPSPAEPYVFYIWNQNVPQFIYVRFPEYGLTEGRKKVTLIQSEHNLSQALNPDPF